MVHAKDSFGFFVVRTGDRRASFPYSDKNTENCDRFKVVLQNDIECRIQSSGLRGFLRTLALTISCLEGFLFVRFDIFQLF